MKNITNEKVSEYLDKFYKPLSEGLFEMRQYGESNHIPIILRDTESFLSYLLGQTKPKKILEIGTAIGYSAIFFAKICPDAEITTIEKSYEMSLVANDNIAKEGLSNRIEVLVGDGEEVINSLESNDYDLVFIDAAKSHYRRFFEAALQHVKKDATILSDNILQRGMTASNDFDKYEKHKTSIRNMREYLDFLHNFTEGETCYMAIGDGLAITKLKEK